MPQGTEMITPMSDPMSEFTERLRSMSTMKLPPMPDMDKVLSAYRRNVEVLSAANRVALEGAQAVAKRHMEIVQQTLSEMGESIKTISLTDTPQAKAVQQADLLKQAYERALANTRELSDMIQHANSEALGLLNGRFIEAMDEVKALVHEAPAVGEGQQAP
jgi:phasin family protein